MATYYHNPKCSKSRKGLELLNQQGVDFTIKEYLKEPMSRDELSQLFEKLGQSPQEAIRTKEDVYQDLGLKEKSLTDDQWIKLIIDHPRLLERPILVTDKKAVIGRPPEELKKLI